MLSVRKQSGETRVQQNLPAGYQLDIVRDNSGTIQTQVNAVKEHLFPGAGLHGGFGARGSYDPRVTAEGGLSGSSSVAVTPLPTPSLSSWRCPPNSFAASALKCRPNPWPSLRVVKP